MTFDNKSLNVVKTYQNETMCALTKENHKNVAIKKIA